MKKTKIVAIVVAIVLVSVGLLIGVIGLHALGYDFRKLNLLEYRVESVLVEEDFSGIEIDVDTADVRFVLTDDDTCKVVYNETEKTEYVVTVENGILKIRYEDGRKWYDHIGVFYEDVNLTVYLPRAEYERVSFKSDTGDISMSGLTLNSLFVETDTGDIALSALNVQSALNITTDTGDVECESINCQSLQICVDTGDIELAGVIASQTMTIKSDTGDVELDRCDAASLDIKTSTGDVSGRLLTPKRYDADASTGDIRVPQSQEGGVCRIRTRTGDIHFS